MVKISVKVDSRIGEKRLRSLVLKAQNFSDVFKGVAKSFYQFQERQFRSGGAEIGGWKPLAKSTLRQKARLGYPSDILVRTGRLMRSLASKTTDTVEEITSRDLRIGTGVPYAIYHQKGTKKMPARPLIALTQKLLDKWTELFAKHFEEKS